LIVYQLNNLFKLIEKGKDRPTKQVSSKEKLLVFEKGMNFSEKDAALISLDQK
jgi:hypothetical protein